MQYIYSRVSTDKQDTENQLLKLKELYPTAVVHEETASGTKQRPILQALLGQLQKGDILIVAALDRLGRKTSDILSIIESLEQRGIILKSIREGVDYSTIAGRLVTQILCSVAEMERNLISERTRNALQAKKRQGVRLGPPPTYSEQLIGQIRAYKQEGKSCRDISKITGMSKSRISEILRSG